MFLNPYASSYSNQLYSNQIYDGNDYPYSIDNYYDNNPDVSNPERRHHYLMMRDSGITDPKWIISHAEINWLCNDKKGHIYLSTNYGSEFLSTPKGQYWLSTQGGHYWLSTQGGQSWLSTQVSQSWLTTLGGQNWLSTRGGQNWYRAKCEADRLREAERLSKFEAERKVQIQFQREEGEAERADLLNIWGQLESSIEEAVSNLLKDKEDYEKWEQELLLEAKEKSLREEAFLQRELEFPELKGDGRHCITESDTSPALAPKNKNKNKNEHFSGNYWQYRSRRESNSDPKGVRRRSSSNSNRNDGNGNEEQRRELSVSPTFPTQAIRFSPPSKSKLEKFKFTQSN